MDRNAREPEPRLRSADDRRLLYVGYRSEDLRFVRWAHALGMDSPDLDGFLFLLAPSGEILASNDDDTDGDTLGSRLQHTATAASTYTAIATILAGDSIGNYALRSVSDPIAPAAE